MSDKRELTQEFFDAIDQKGIAGIVPFLADDFVWWAAGMGEIQAEVLKFGEMLDPHIDGKMQMKVHSILVEGNKCAVEAESFAKLKNGNTYNNHYHFKISFEGDKIKEVKEYNDTKHADEALKGILT